MGKGIVYGSVCSGIEAASCAWDTLPWRPAWFAEIEPFPSAVLKHHYPDVVNRGDFTNIGVDADERNTIDLLVGGTPCQSFSVAGGRAGLDDPRGNLTLEFARLADRLRPRWIVWENVPGVLSIDSGRTFGAFLGALGQIGYGFAYRVLDAQYFGVAQRRRRVFVVGCLGDWRRAAAVLLERESLHGDIAPSRETGQNPAHSLRGRPNASMREDSDTYVVSEGFEVGPSSGHFTDLAPTMDARAKDGPIRNQLRIGVYQHRRWEGKTHELDVSTTVESRWGTGGNNMPFVLSGATSAGMRDTSTALNTSQQRLDADTETLIVKHPPIGLDEEQNAVVDGFGTLKARERGGGFEGTVIQNGATVTGATVRRLTPVECERLQGFPDGYTNVIFKKKPAADGNRYKALGNAFAVPVVRWIGERIQMVEEVTP